MPRDENMSLDCIFNCVGCITIASNYCKIITNIYACQELSKIIFSTPHCQKQKPPSVSYGQWLRKIQFAGKAPIR